MQYTKNQNVRTVEIKKSDSIEGIVRIPTDEYDNAIITFYGNLLKLYMWFSAHIQGDTVHPRPSVVCTQCNFSKSTYYRAFNKLMEKGYIIPKNNNVYEFYNVA